MGRVPRERIGADGALRHHAFQVGSGLGAALSGAPIGPPGFTVAFLSGASLQAVPLWLVVTRRSVLHGTADGDVRRKRPAS